jgi:spore cortex formation protein SpoVR/YcgB (stage V sporulation)
MNDKNTTLINHYLNGEVCTSRAIYLSLSQDERNSFFDECLDDKSLRHVALEIKTKFSSYPQDSFLAAG